LIDLFIYLFIYFTFRQIFTDIEAVIVIHKSTQACKAFVTSQFAKQPKHRLIKA